MEWLHALLPDAARLPEWIADRLRHQPMLFIGCEIPDWIGRFLLRMSSTDVFRMSANSSFSSALRTRAYLPCRISSLRIVVDRWSSSWKSADRICFGVV